MLATRTRGEFLDHSTTDHYAIERICSAQNELFKTVPRAVRVAAFKSPNRSVKF